MAVSESSIQRSALRDPDVRLMLEVRSGNAAAFEELVQRYQVRVLAVLEHLVGNRHQAEDLAQEVFLRIYRARNTYQPNAKFATWLFKIVNNLALNQLRNCSRRREMSTDFRPDGSQFREAFAEAVQVSSGQMPARRLDKMEMRDIIRLALESLNERQRLAILLCKFEGMSYADIATAMDMSPKAVKSLLSRARVRLKDILEPYIETGKMPISLAEAEATMDWGKDADDSGEHAETPRDED
ncbi:sigma-70 family RNA polymerase sigma factor [Thermopirellula anaerolimosa]